MPSTAKPADRAGGERRQLGTGHPRPATGSPPAAEPGAQRRDAGSPAGAAGAVGWSATTSIAVTSGAAASMAPSTASSSVTDDDGQPSQLPSSRSRTTPSSVTSEQLDVAAVRAEVGADAVQRPLDPRSGRRSGCRPCTSSRLATSSSAASASSSVVVEPPALVRSVEQPLQPGAVQVGDQPDQLLGALAGHRRRRRSWRRAAPRSARPAAAGRRGRRRAPGCGIGVTRR